MNYYRRYVGDYLRDTMRLTPTDHGVYGLMLDFYYAEEKPLPLDHDEIHAICKAIKPDDRKAVAKVLAAYFIRQADGYHNLRADKEIATSQQARTNGSGKKVRGSDEGGGLVGGNGTGLGTGSLGGMDTKKGGGSGHPPTTNHQPPSASPQPSASTLHETSPDAPATRPRSGRKDQPAKTSAIWQAYGEAYRQRYNVDPLRNAKVNGMLARFMERVPVEEGPGIAGFFVRSNRGLYVSSKHCVDLLLRDAEALRTEWATGQQGSDSVARLTDQTAGRGQVFGNLIAEAEAAGGK